MIVQDGAEELYEKAIVAKKFNCWKDYNKILVSTADTGCSRHCYFKFQLLYPKLDFNANAMEENPIALHYFQSYDLSMRPW